MKKLKLLVPSLVTVGLLPTISAVSCGPDIPKGAIVINVPYHDPNNPLINLLRTKETLQLEVGKEYTFFINLDSYDDHAMTSTMFGFRTENLRGFYDINEKVDILSANIDGIELTEGWGGPYHYYQATNTYWEIYTPYNITERYHAITIVAQVKDDTITADPLYPVWMVE